MKPQSAPQKKFLLIGKLQFRVEVHTDSTVEIKTIQEEILACDWRSALRDARKKIEVMIQETCAGSNGTVNGPEKCDMRLFEVAQEREVLVLI